MSEAWHRRTLRWGQTNITELDSQTYDIEWWRQHWRRTKVQGVVVNAGGIVAYYPSKYPLHYRAQFLEGRDLYGEINAVAREEGLAVLARMDSNRATEDFFLEKPEWFCRNNQGNPIQVGDRYTACIFSEYYDEFLTDVLKEIIDRYQPDGFTDNSWSGMNHGQICYCENCKQNFLDSYGLDLPSAINWDDRVFKKWIKWNYDRRIHIWDLNNKVAQEHSGNPDCLWLGMISGSPMTESFRFREMKGILERSRFIMLDHQHRPSFGFQSNSHAGKLLHGLMGWDKLIPESMPVYQGRTPAFRLSSKPVPEAHMWMAEGFAGTIQPWWHHIGAYHEDRRQYRTSEPMMNWHADNDDYLINRTPVASVGIVWSHENIDYYGKETPEESAIWPHEGFVQAMIHGRIPYIPIHADHIKRDSDKVSLLVLPNLAAMSDEQIEAVKQFVENGGSLVASGETSLYDEWGDKREGFGLAEILGIRHDGGFEGNTKISAATWEVYDHHSYMRLHPSRGESFYGPQIGNEVDLTTDRHGILEGFGDTDILPFGGRIENIEVTEDACVPLSYIPEFPIFPPEFSWMREHDTGKPIAVVREHFQGGRIVYLPADIDRCFRRDNFPDHGNLLVNVIRWASNGKIPCSVSGPGLIDCQIYEQEGRRILHMVNLTGTTQEPLHEIISVGPFSVRIRGTGKVRSLVTSAIVESEESDGWVQFDVPSIDLHEVFVIEP